MLSLRILFVVHAQRLGQEQVQQSARLMGKISSNSNADTVAVWLCGSALALLISVSLAIKQPMTVERRNALELCKAVPWVQIIQVLVMNMPLAVDFAVRVQIKSQLIQTLSSLIRKSLERSFKYPSYLSLGKSDSFFFKFYQYFQQNL